MCFGFSFIFFNVWLMAVSCAGTSNGAHSICVDAEDSSNKSMIFIISMSAVVGGFVVCVERAEFGIAVDLVCRADERNDGEGDEATNVDCVWVSFDIKN